MLTIKESQNLGGGKENQNSVKDLTFSNMKTNILNINGFTDSGSHPAKSLSVSNLLVKDSTFDVVDSLILTDKYKYSGEASLNFVGVTFSNLIFSKFGSVILLSQNSKNEVLI